jgi:deoxyribodipyrimidine photo-lyase
MKTAIVWFKTDLRLYDNEVKSNAQGEKVRLCIALMMQTL